MLIVALILFVQIVLESIPLSSSTHVMLLAQQLQAWGYHVPVMSESFEHMMHVPSIIVVCAALSQWHATPGVYWRLGYNRRRAFWYGFLVTLSTALTVAAYYMVQRGVIVWPWGHRGGLLITAAALLVSCLRGMSDRPMRIWHAMVIGCAQAIALSSGVSRLGFTYAAGRLVGWSPKRALTYSLFLQLVLMSGAVVRALWNMDAGLTLLYDCRLLLVVGVAMLAAYAALRGVMLLAERGRLWVIGFYVAILAILV